VGSIAILDVVVQNCVFEELEFHSSQKMYPCRILRRIPLLAARRDISWKLIHTELQKVKRQQQRSKCHRHWLLNAMR
jgi:hypothetical protein